MADSALKLPGKFEAGKKYLIDGTTLKAWQAALLADRIIPGAGLTETGTPQGRILKAGPGGGGTFAHPFRITVGTEGYQVSKGSIILGTNGAAYPFPASGFFDTARTASANYLVLQATVGDDLELPTSSNPWAFALVSEADSKEVVMTTTAPIKQTKLRLLLGKITLDGSVATAWQAQFSSVRVVHGIFNGVEVLVLENAPTHPSAI